MSLARPTRFLILSLFCMLLCSRFAASGGEVVAVEDENECSVGQRLCLHVDKMTLSRMFWRREPNLVCVYSNSFVWEIVGPTLEFGGRAIFKHFVLERKCQDKLTECWTHVEGIGALSEQACMEYKFQGGSWAQRQLSECLRRFQVVVGFLRTIERQTIQVYLTGDTA